MSINITLIAQMLAFGFIVWFTMKYIWPPLMTAMQEREKKIADGLAAAEKGSAALEEAKAEQDGILKAARDEAQEIVASANRQATDAIEQSKDTAREEAERIRTQAAADAEQELNRQREALRQEVSGLALAAAEKILRREVDAKAHAEVLDQLAAKI